MRPFAGIRNIVMFFAIATIVLWANVGMCQTEWTKHPGNPVVDLGTGGTWDGNGTYSSTVLFDGTAYRMWYSGYDGSHWRIGYATSMDGIVWERHPANPVFSLGASGTWDDSGVYAPTVLFDGTAYRMWYTGSDGSQSRIGFAASVDGIVWERYPANPVLSLGASGTWDGYHVINPTILFDGTSYRMWYSGSDGSHWRVGYATSMDGIVWERYPANPLFSLGASGTWDDNGVYAPTVLSESGGYKMWYSGHDGSHWRIGYATSMDGIVWTRYPDNPVMGLGESGTWDDEHITIPGVLFDGTAYRMWYSGSDGSYWRIGYAISIPANVIGIAPTSRGQGASSQDIVITGSDFLNGAAVSFSGGGITVNSTTFVSSTQLVANIDIASGATLGTRDVIVTNPDNKTSIGEDMFAVNAAPTVTSTNPGSLLQGTENRAIIIAGSGFMDNHPDDPNGPQLTADFGDGITVNSVTFISPMELVANISIAQDAAAGLRDVTVINGDAGVGIGTGIFAVGLPPTITSVTPMSRGQGATGQDIVVAGTDFLDGTVVSFSGDGIMVNSTAFRSSTELAANIDVASDAPVGVRDVIVTNPDNQTSIGEDMFAVNAAPAVTSTSPDSLLQSSENEDVIIAGSGFVDNLAGDPNGPQLTADFGDGITVNSVAFISSTELTANISIAQNAAIGTRNVTVSNGDAGVGIAASIFTVVSSDTIPPAAVTDLSATTSNSIQLQWTAPGDDGDTGTASVYIIRYNTVPITEANWDESSDVAGEPTPKPAGSAESMSAVMPYPGVMYYFAIKTQDEVPNTSDISNSPSAHEVTTHLYAGWNLVAFTAPTVMPIEDAILSISEQCRCVWRYDASISGWLRYIMYGPPFVNNLREMGPGCGYWIWVTEDCKWNSRGGALSAPDMALRKPPFMLYGRITGDITSCDSPNVSLKIGTVEAASYVLGSNPLYEDYYVLEIPVDDPFREGDVARIYIDGVLAEGDYVRLGGMGTIERCDVAYTRTPAMAKLFQNYPNPFNPDTWIPYQLAQEVDVTIRIYDFAGHLIRTLDLGHKSARFYTTKDKAAYWDGRNEAGEQVSSGVYFCTIEAGDYTATKKLVIMK